MKQDFCFKQVLVVTADFADFGSKKAVSSKRQSVKA